MKDLRIILDANFLMAPENSGVDVFDELERIVSRKYELVVPEAVIEELETIKREKKGSESRAAKVALELSKDLETIPSEKTADEEIIRLAQQGGSAVATNDSEVQDQLREGGIPVIYLRQGSYLDTYGKI